MKVLIADFDLFLKIGGGQTFYRSLIEKNPQIDFYYLRVDESSNTNRPVNATAIPYKEKYWDENYKFFHDLTPPRWTIGSFVKASNIAASLSGFRFDVVDIPDYEQYGLFLRPALTHHNVGFSRIVLSLHGRISTTIKLNWSTEGKVDMICELQENMQYAAVDVRYGISKTYLDEWRQVVNLESHYLNPLSVISLPTPTLVTHPSDQAPHLNFIGRTEKRKGPDIFIELAQWLPRSSFSTANIIGSESYDYKGVGSGLYLYQMANNRLKDIQILPAKDKDELAKLFASKSVTFLPSKYDTLNLLALESLFSGCPTVIGNGAGVIRFLEENFPQIPYIKLDIKNIYSSISSICSLLENYDDYRQNLVDALLTRETIISDLGLELIYESQSSYDSKVRFELDEWYSKLISVDKLNLSFTKVNTKKIIKTILKSQNLPEIKKRLADYKSFLADPRYYLKKTILSQIKNGEDLKIVDQGIKSMSTFDRYRNIFNIGEETERGLSEKIQQCWNVAGDSRIDRVRIWREIARLERIRGNEIVAATYQLRAMRALGYDHFHDLSSVVSILKANGFSLEAIAAEAMYGNFSDQEERCATFLEQRLADNKHNQSWEYEFVDDRRDQSTYRASVIVSLYNAATKLPLFLQALQQQTLIQAGAAEVILIDSGSPADEYSAFKQSIMSLNIPIVYARCDQRETIQSAWNRGIALSRSPYLAFLGVDETILPECLEILAGELDADPTLDWVQGNSIVTNVDKNGVWVNDIMIYDRKGYKQDLVYLETCYLSWVGALYRRSIHDRFGFYDTSFRAAGDTEFKNRVLPFIKTKSLPRTLGIFWNYPDERTTQHPRAEIEDLRAWYLHRTLPGVKYAFANRNPEEAEELLYACLKYRKSYCGHWSMDIDYAYNVANFIFEKIPNSPVLVYFDGIKKLLDAHRSLDWIPKLANLTPTSAILRTNNAVRQIEKNHRDISNQTVEPIYKIFNDNRHEQHSYLWFTPI
jgi:glycosyltransferase involved in cell wall biosynthesis